MTFKSTHDGSATVRNVTFALRSDDEAYLLAMLAHAREQPGAMPYHVAAIDALADAIRRPLAVRDVLDLVDNTFHPRNLKEAL